MRSRWPPISSYSAARRRFSTHPSRHLSKIRCTAECGGFFSGYTSTKLKRDGKSAVRMLCQIENTESRKSPGLLRGFLRLSQPGLSIAPQHPNSCSGFPSMPCGAVYCLGCGDPAHYRFSQAIRITLPTFTAAGLRRRSKWLAKTGPPLAPTGSDSRALQVGRYGDFST